MLRVIVLGALVLGLGSFGLGVPSIARAEVTRTRQVTLQTFEVPLAGQGEWLETAGHGLVWRPTGLAPGWRPYVNGTWLWTEEGWFWASDEPWSWAAYHYGRWAEDPQYSWIWIPGTEWAPAWVEWRVGDRVVGWAPLGPRGGSLRPTLEHWVFVPVEGFANLLVSKSVRDPDSLRADWAATRPSSGLRTGATARTPETPPFGGPARVFVERRMGVVLEPARLIEVASPAALRRAGSLGVFRPGYRPTFQFERPKVDRELEYEEE